MQKRIDKFIEEGDRKRLVNLNYDLKNKDRNFPGLNEKERYQLESIIDTSLEVAPSLQKKKIRSNIPNYEELKERINNFHQKKKNTDLKALRAHLEKKDSFIQLEKEQKDELISLINEFQPRKMETKMGKKNIDDLREEIKNAIEEKNAKKLANFKTCLNTKSKYPDIKQTDKEVLIEEIKKCDFVTEYVSNYHKQLNQRKKTEKEEEKFSLKDIKSEVKKVNF